MCFILNCDHYFTDGGSLLLCHPSENLRKLVPKSILNISQLNVGKSEFGGTSNDSGTELGFQFVRNENRTNEDRESDHQPTGIKLKAEKSIDRSDQNLRASSEDNVCLLTRPTMVFILESHNLEKLRYSLKRNLRISTCRIYSLQSLNWLMRTVTHASCLHDLMWWFVTSLKSSLPTSSTSGSVGTEDNSCAQTAEDNLEQALDHPVSSQQMCGKISLLLTQSFHTYLQTVADLTLLLPAGSALQQIAIQCFGIKFRQADHQFLHRSHVFGNISKILSRSEEQNEDVLLLSSAAMFESNSNCWGPQVLTGNHDTKIINLVDLVGMFEVSNFDSRIENMIETFLFPR